MSTVMKSAPILALIVLATLIPSAASAQEQRLRVSFGPSLAALGGDAELTLGGTVGYRFSEHFWFEGDLTWFDDAAGGFRDRVFEFDGRTAAVGGLLDTLGRRGDAFGRGGIAFPTLRALPTFPIGGTSLRAATGGSTVVGTLGLRYELPVQTARFRPYVSGGLGINRTHQEFEIDFLSIDESTSRTGYAFNAGAGASIRLAGQLWGELDTKYFRLSNDRDVMRLGGGVSFRF